MSKHNRNVQVIRVKGCGCNKPTADNYARYCHSVSISCISGWVLLQTRLQLTARRRTDRPTVRTAHFIHHLLSPDAQPTTWVKRFICIKQKLFVAELRHDRLHSNTLLLWSGIEINVTTSWGSTKHKSSQSDSVRGTKGNGGMGLWLHSLLNSAGNGSPVFIPRPHKSNRTN